MHGGMILVAPAPGTLGRMAELIGAGLIAAMILKVFEQQKRLDRLEARMNKAETVE